MKNIKKVLKRIWHFIWVEDSWSSWIVNVILAFVIIKFLVYPGLGLLLGTQFPIVAVVSSSMEHNTLSITNNNVYQICGNNFENRKFLDLDEYWEVCGGWYEENNVSKLEFSEWSFKNGFNKGDLMILRGKTPENIEPGDVIVFSALRPDLKPEPIIHRVVKKWNMDRKYFFQTKGDNNEVSWNDTMIGETEISEQRIYGTAALRIPYLGYVKILFVEFLNLFR